MSQPEIEWVTVAEFARRAGLTETKAVYRAIRKGVLTRGNGDLLDAALALGQWHKPNRRTVQKMAGQPNGTSKVVPFVGTTLLDGETPQEAAERIVGEAGALLSLPEALKLKENYLARHQQLSYDLKCGTVVIAADVAKAVGAEYATVRTRMLAIPSEMAPAIYRLTSVVEVEDLLRSVIGQALEELTRDGIHTAA